MRSFRVEYYSDRRGNQPVRDWLRSLGTKDRAVIRDKITALEEQGLSLLATQVLRKLRGLRYRDLDLYELRPKPFRIGVYFDSRNGAFILLHGWRGHAGPEEAEFVRLRHARDDYLSKGTR